MDVAAGAGSRGAGRELTARLMKGGAGVFGLRVGALLLGLCADWVLTNSLGIERYGVFAIGISWLSVLIPVGALGMNTALLKVVPAEHGAGRTEVVRGALAWTSRRMLLAGVVVGALFAGGVLLAGDRVDPGLRSVLLVLAGFLPVQVLSVHRQSVLQAFKHPVLALLPEQVLRVGAFLLLIAGLYLWRGEQLAVLDAAWAYGLGMTVGLAFAVFWSRDRTPRAVRAAVPRFEASAWWLLALPLCWNTVMRLLNSRADPAMLGWLLGEDGLTSAAGYSIANRLASLLLFGMVAVNAVAAPWISELHAKGARAELQRLVTLSAKGLTAYALPLALVLVGLGPWLLAFFGEGFEESYGTLCLLVLGRLVTCLAGTVGFLLAMTGHQARVAKLMTGCAALKITLNLVLIPTYGEVGAAFATTVMLCLFTALAWRDVRRLVGVEPTILASFGWLPKASATGKGEQR